ncbi:7-cyano-7-deazaguanine synthase [Methanoculleus horonobensis]|uniref:7-cyano-7-deazaguanine synthase n=1 Tax=Methanoculleus horonobensis TaxID=528314 RepID=UPI0009FD2A77|nr:7-cyano-7-deazaguanine synthase [Methanoculleus horonobensis]
MKIDKTLIEKHKLNINSEHINRFFFGEEKNAPIRERLPARLDDFVRVIMYCNFIDRLNVCEKDEQHQIEIPVYDLPFWKDEEEQLVKILWSLYRRDFFLDFIFETSQKPKTQIQTKLFDEDREELLLFSEGLDSIAAATVFQKATLIHVIKSTYTESHLKNVMNLFPERKIKTITYGLRGENLPRDTGISNSRGLIFLGLASVHLGLSKSNTLITGENGVMMHNPPLFEGSKPTRTMNPSFVRLLQGLLSDIYSEDIQIKTPFLKMTKKEVLEVAKRNLNENFKTAIECSYSCFSQQPRGNETKMCGRCCACLLRTISIRSLQGYDNSMYERSPFSEDFSDGKGAANVMDLMRFSRGVLQHKLPYVAAKVVMQDEDLFHRFAQDVMATIRKIPDKSAHLNIESERPNSL